MGKVIKRAGIKEIASPANLTNGESWFLHRRSLGFRQEEMAARLKISHYSYKMIEYDRVDTPVLVPAIKVLRPHEVCAICRRRAGISQLKIAKALKVSRWWLVQMENGDIDCAPLLKWWKNKYGSAN